MQGISDMISAAAKSSQHTRQLLLMVSRFEVRARSRLYDVRVRFGSLILERSVIRSLCSRPTSSQSSLRFVPSNKQVLSENRYVTLPHLISMLCYCRIASCIVENIICAFISEKIHNAFQNGS